MTEILSCVARRRKTKTPRWARSETGGELGRPMISRSQASGLVGPRHEDRRDRARPRGGDPSLLGAYESSGCPVAGQAPGSRRRFFLKQFSRVFLSPLAERSSSNRVVIGTRSLGF